MNWFIVVYFFVNGSWTEADILKKEGWSPIEQPSYEICMKKINESNERFKKIADYRNTELDIKFTCECRKNENSKNNNDCKQRNWLQRKIDALKSQFF